MTGPLPPKLYTTCDLAKMFSVDRKTVVAWVEQGKLVPAMDVGGRTRHSWRFDPDEVEKFYQRERERCCQELDRRCSILSMAKGM